MYFSTSHMYVAIPQPYNSKLTPRSANKTNLADALWHHMPDNTPLPKINSQYILDHRGTLLHRVSLCKGIAFEEACKHYVKYVNNHYGTPIVVFM